jgi:hypothetical protein
MRRSSQLRKFSGWETWFPHRAIQLDQGIWHYSLAVGPSDRGSNAFHGFFQRVEVAMKPPENVHESFFQ